MERLMIVCFSLLINCHAQSQNIDWDKTENWRVYSIQNSKAIKISEDSLKNAHSLPLNKIEILQFLQSSQLLTIKEPPFWNGIFLFSYETRNGKMNKVFISSNGSFFMDKNSGKYYEVLENDRDSWKEYINENLKRLSNISH